MYVRNKDEVSERVTEAVIRRQMRLQLDHMVCSYSPCIHIPSQQHNLAALVLTHIEMCCCTGHLQLSEEMGDVICVLNYN